MRTNQRNILYFFALGLYLLAKDLEISSAYHTFFWMPKLLDVFRYTSYAMVLGISIFMTNYTFKVLIRYIIFMLFFLLVSLNVGSLTIFYNFMFIFAAKDIPIKKLIKYVVILHALICACIVLGTFSGIIEDWIYDMAGRFRHSMGYGYPNSIHSILFYTIIAGGYLLKNRIKFWQLVVFEIINYLLFRYTNTRTAFALTAIALVVFWLMKFVKTELKSNRITRLLYVHSVYLIAIMSILLSYFYNPGNVLMSRINDLISNRLSLGQNALMVNNITLFGQKIQWYGFGGLGYTMDTLAGEYNNVDCSYVRILLDNGLIMLVLVIVGYMFVANEELKKGDRYFCVALLFANLYAIIEPRYIETGFSPFVWCLSSLIGNELYLAVIKGYVKLKNRSLLKKKQQINLTLINYKGVK